MATFQNLSYHNAVAIQERLLSKLDLKPAVNLRNLKTVTGIDCSYAPRQKRKESRPLMGYAVVVLCSYPALGILEIAKACMEIQFPYIPGLLAFREFPLIEKAWKELKRKPDCILCDGQGIAHPRRMGIASHAGIMLDCPSIGVAKSILVGKSREPGVNRGSWRTLYDDREPVGVLLRTRTDVKPVVVSPGHKMDISTARRIVLHLCRGYRLPEVIRFAHHAVNQMRRERES